VYIRPKPKAQGLLVPDVPGSIPPSSRTKKKGALQENCKNPFIVKKLQ
jgi:hypothetical protein